MGWDLVVVRVEWVRRRVVGDKFREVNGGRLGEVLGVIGRILVFTLSGMGVIVRF